MKIEGKRMNDAFHFEFTGPSEITVNTDASPDIGGHNEGSRPMELLLMGVAGCSAIDVALILKKQRVQIDDFLISVRGERKEAVPSPFEKIHLHYTLKGTMSHSQLKYAIDLSIKKYCSAIAQLQSSAVITYTYECK